MTTTFVNFSTRVSLVWAAICLPLLLAAQVSVSFVQTNVTCKGACDGSATASGTSGATPYSFAWSNGGNAATATGLCAGVYTVTVTSANQSTGTGAVTITEPAALTVTLSVHDQICTLVPDGYIVANPGGGTFPYTYQWSTGGFGDEINGLGEGTYTVTVTDANQCTATAEGSVVNTNEGVWLMDSTVDVRCFGGNDGFAHISPMSGLPPYTYAWSQGDSTQDIVNMMAGTYTVTVTDANGCSNTWVVDISQPSPLDADIITIPATCTKPGRATIIPSGGTPPYTILWSNDSTTATISAPAGMVAVTLTDNNGCTFLASLTIPSSTIVLNIDNQLLSSAGCLIGGSARASAAGGSGNYSFAWSNGANTALATDLKADSTYVVTVTDLPTGCTGTASITIPAVNPSLSVEATVISQANCAGGGVATAVAAGGVPPFVFVWDNTDTTATANNLSAGTHIVVVTDSTGCTATDTVMIIQLTPPVVSTQALSLADCLGGGGSAMASVDGGVSPFLFTWSNGDSTATATNLPAGIFTVTVTDAVGCKDTGFVTILLSTPPAISITVTVPATCLAPASALAILTGGTAPFKYAWDNGDNTAIGHLNPGMHVLTVTDNAGCTATATVNIAQPPMPTVSTQADKLANCTGGGGQATATAAGGTSPYHFAWSNSDTTAIADNLSAGIYTVTVTDNGGCTATATVSIVLAPSPTVTAQMDKLANCTGGGGQATATPAGGTAPYHFAWSNGDTTAIAQNLSAGTFTVTVTDNSGCTGTTTVSIGQAPLPNVATSITTAATCVTLGSALAVANGGTPPYTFLWSNTQNTAQATGLAPGSYTVLVTDLAGCTVVGTATVAEPPKPVVSIVSSTDASCGQPGSATAAATGGTPPYTWLWDNGDTSAVSNNLTAGTHTVIVTDAGGCTDTVSVTIGQSSTGGVTVGDFVWLDNDQDGFQHPSEQGAPNITVRLFQAGPDQKFGTADDVLVNATATNANGKYQFACIPYGTYILKFSGLPAGFEFSSKDKVNNDCKDSDAKPDGATDPFTLSATQGDNLCLDAGIHIICNNVMNAGLICCNQTICEGETPDLLYEIQPPLMGTGTLEYLWMQFLQVGNMPPAWVAIPGANGISYQPGPLFQTAYFMRCVRRQGCLVFLETNIITITVKPAGSPGCDPFAGNFTVSALRGGSAVQIQWATKPELNPFLYVVERSADQIVWTTVEEKMGQMNATAPNTYTVLDHTPVDGMNYYRIKRRSAGGGESMSEVRDIEVHMDVEASLAVFPNPVSQSLHVRNLMTYDSDAQLELFSTNGVRLEAMNIPAGTYQALEWPMGDLPEGIYLLRIRMGKSNVRTVKVTKF
ncbi:MAG: hypothetical protein IT260_21650 [Saprospiraceae bacterium]|nr:hypothetical protein [Saprospiraceae bacterium]